MGCRNDTIPPPPPHRLHYYSLNLKPRIHNDFSRRSPKDSPLCFDEIPSGQIRSVMQNVPSPSTQQGQPVSILSGVPPENQVSPPPFQNQSLDNQLTPDVHLSGGQFTNTSNRLNSLALVSGFTQQHPNNLMTQHYGAVSSDQNQQYLNSHSLITPISPRVAISVPQEMVLQRTLYKFISTAGRDQLLHCFRSCLSDDDLRQLLTIKAKYANTNTATLMCQQLQTPAPEIQNRRFRQLEKAIYGTRRVTHQIKEDPDAAPVAQVSTWSSERVCEWLRGIPFGSQYDELFRQQGVNGIKLLSLTEQNLLNDFGLDKTLHRKRISKEIDVFRSMCDTDSADSAVNFRDSQDNVSDLSDGAAASESMCEPKTEESESQMFKDDFRFMVRKTRAFECHFCDEVFTRHAQLKKHVSAHPGVNMNYFQCLQCGKVCNTRGALKAHTSTHSNIKPHACPHCDKRFGNIDYVRKHILTHTANKTHACMHCDKRFTMPGYLRRHMDVHTQPKQHQCHQCSARFLRLVGLKRHLLSHAKAQPYQCEQCGKKFADSFTLVQHRRVHTGERPFKCQVCGKTFTRRKTLTRHLKIHSGVTPYACLHCHRRFSRKDNMKTHLKTHNVCLLEI